MDCLAKRTCRSVVGIAVVEQVFEADFTGCILPDVRSRTTYAAGQNELSDSMTCFTCTKSLQVNDLQSSVEINYSVPDLSYEYTAVSKYRWQKC